MNSRFQRPERPPAATRTTGAAGRPALRQPTARTSALRQPVTHHGVAAARIDRSVAPSPADSMLSVATAGAKRKDRDFEIEAAGEETNINVVVRCRGRNDREVKENSAVVVSTDAVKGKQVELSMGPSALSNKTYQFDRVFSPAADQTMVYDEVVKPILEEMLGGFNCTIFAYGQTGTGKTYTMSGDMDNTLGLLSDNAGIIPRVLQSLFNKLDMEDTESFVKCSFIELYNEELKDLIAADDSVKLKIFDDTSRKSHASTVVQGMEETHIKNAEQGIKLLQKGSLKRQVAATKCNDLSSRSHTVFTITACIKRTGEDGEDYVSAGKLNLVDLAGSENIQRSGAENKRAAEAGLINKSLLTLGRVINALVDRGSHIPYRESKLTRLLQDSLGGRTKTCIIATVSPAKSNLEETISTLDYAFRAKNIRNKPQLNQLISKKTLFREFTHEIERLKSELIATRQRNGVYLTNDSYEEMTMESESRRIQNEEQAAKLETMESNLKNKVQELFSLTSNFMGLRSEHDSVKMHFDKTKGLLDQTELVLEATRKSLNEEIHVRKAHQRTEEQIHVIGGELISTVQQTVKDLDGLRAKNKRKSDLQMLNKNTWASAQDQVADVTAMVESRIEAFQTAQEEHIATISGRMQSFVTSELQKLSSTQAFLDQNLELFVKSKKELIEQQQTSRDEMDGVLEEIKVVREHIKERVGESLQAIAAAAERIAHDVVSELVSFHGELNSSYSSIGTDVRSTFDNLLQVIATQKKQSDKLSEQVQAAGDSMVQANTNVSARLQEAVVQERKQAATERKALLNQITALINTQAETEQSRWEETVDTIGQNITENNETFGSAADIYVQGMSTWNEKEEALLERVTKSKDALDAKLQCDWTAANAKSSSIQETTKSVQAETVRVVEEQLEDLHEQMTSLDDFVTRARSQNAQHNDRHGASLRCVSSTVEGSYNSIGEHFKTTFARVNDLSTDMQAEVSAVQDTLQPLAENLSQPLADLREDISNTGLTDYQPTGETPRKMDYDFPTELPRTQAHERLIAKFNGVLSPVKSRVFADADPSLAENRSPARRYHSEAIVSSVRDKELNPFSASLREVNPNVNSTLGAFDPKTTATIHEFDASLAPLGLDGVSLVADSDVTMPLFKKSRLTKLKGIRQTMATSDDRENMPLLADIVPGMGKEIFAQSMSRRKSPRLN
ncbi:P-loop containing nucleoside triphosphate hydrolase protein [Microdochium bolleyi]|uniref:p-loop containing nucleoside triphosphate hydrolase protein n=1 Tax=Microdochium bolleyi TaxID=196109 RepID=A0A136IXR9_9PEZI|nr:P-loop containing nucleoside triphosphate hydrolase protein [Microdochium bolleyi]